MMKNKLKCLCLSTVWVTESCRLLHPKKKHSLESDDYLADCVASCGILARLLCLFDVENALDYRLYLATVD